MPNNPFFEDINAIVKKLKVIDDQTYKVIDKEFHVAYKQPYMKWNQPLDVFGQNLGEEKQVQTNLNQHISSALYSHFYCPGRTNMKTFSEVEINSVYPDANKRATTIAELSQVNHTKEGFDPMWNVYNIDASNNVFVTKNGQVRYLLPNQWTFANPSDQQLKVGSYVNLKLSKEDTQIQEVFYHVKGEELVSQQAGFIRIYFNTNFEGAKVLVSEITSHFNKYKVPFMFKCLNHPDLFNRTDSAVLYVNQTYSKIAFQILKMILPQIKPHLKKEVPLFSLPIFPGMSFSEDPGDGQSFGMSRCKILGEAIVEAYNKDKNEHDEKMKIVLTRLEKSGINIEKMYLKPNSQFPYDLSIFNNPKN